MEDEDKPRFYVTSASVLNNDEVAAVGADEVEWLDEYDNLLFERTEEGLRYVNSDGGEPEDQTLSRNWSWVAGELNKAYARS